VTITVPGTLEGLAEALRAAESFCDGPDASWLPRANVLTVLDEVLANVVHHGLAGTAGTIELSMHAGAQRVTMDVSDSAAPFNPLLLPAPDTSLPLEKRKIGGLGIALVRALTDDVTYEQRGGRNCLTLTWRPDPKDSKDRHAD
jgi:serine/threonine-protein kinase RsbW